MILRTAARPRWNYWTPFCPRKLANDAMSRWIEIPLRIVHSDGAAENALQQARPVDGILSKLAAALITLREEAQPLLERQSGELWRQARRGVITRTSTMLISKNFVHWSRVKIL